MFKEEYKHEIKKYYFSYKNRKKNKKINIL